MSNPSHEAHLHALATNPEYRLMEQTGITLWRWDLYLALKRFRNALVASFTWPALRRVIRWATT